MILEKIGSSHSNKFKNSLPKEQRILNKIENKIKHMIQKKIVHENFFLQEFLKVRKTRSSNNLTNKQQHFTQNIMIIRKSVVNQTTKLNSIFSKEAIQIINNQTEEEQKIRNEISKSDENQKECLNLVNNSNKKFEENPEMKNSKLIESRRYQKFLNIYDSIEEFDEIDLEISENLNSIFFIYPQSSFKRSWNIIIIVLSIYNMLFIPVFIAFYQNEFFIQIEIIIDLLFICDLILNFFVPYSTFEDEKLVLNHKNVVIYYLSGFFTLDLITSIPYAILFKVFKNSNSGFYISYFRITKLLKIMKIFDNDDKTFEKLKNINFVEDLFLDNSLLRLFYFIMWLILISHVIACSWIFLFTKRTINWANSLDSGTYIEIYISSIYFVWTTIFTVGYGDIIATTKYERAFNIVLMSLGICAYSFALTSVSSIITNSDLNTKKYMQNLNLINALPIGFESDLYRKLKTYIKDEFKTNLVEKYCLISELPSKIRYDLLYEMYRNEITSFPFFKLSLGNGSFNSRVVLLMKSVKLTKNDIIIREGEQVNEMFLVNKGILRIELRIENETIKIFDLRRSDHYGDVLCLTNSRSPTFIKVKSKNAEIFLIPKQELVQISVEFPQIWTEITKIGFENHHKLENLIKKKRNLFEQKSKNEFQIKLVKFSSNKILPLGRKKTTDSVLVKQERYSKPGIEERKSIEEETSIYKKIASEGNLKELTIIDNNSSKKKGESIFNSFSQRAKTKKRNFSPKSTKNVKSMFIVKKFKEDNENLKFNSIRTYDFTKKAVKNNKQLGTFTIRSANKKSLNNLNTNIRFSKAFELPQRNSSIKFQEKQQLKICSEARINYQPKIKKLNNYEISKLSFSILLSKTKKFKSQTLQRQKFSWNIKKPDLRKNLKLKNHFSVFAKNNLLLDRILSKKGSFFHKNNYSIPVSPSIKMMKQYHEQMEKTLHFEKDPNSFMNEEIHKIGKKFLSNKKIEFMNSISKLEKIMNLLKKLRDHK